MRASDPDDAEAIARSIADPEAFMAVFQRHFAAIHRYLARRLGPDLADDLAAETFAQAFRSRGRFAGGEGGAAPWLHGIAANLIRRHRRREERALRAYARLGRDPLLPESEAALERASAAAEGPRRAAALAALRPGDREALLLLAWADLGYAEIGRALGIPEGTARSRVHRARRLLRERLAFEPVEPGGEAGG